MAAANELTRAQIDNLKAVTGNSEEEVLRSYGKSTVDKLEKIITKIFLSHRPRTSIF